MNSSSLPADIIGVLKSIWKDNHPVPLHAPMFGGNELTYVQETINSTFVSSVGAYVDCFEKMIENYTGIKRAVAVVNGTAALHIALLVSGVQPGDEVIIPALTFVATANAVQYCGATPHFVDVEYYSLGMDAEKLDDYLKDVASIGSDETINRYTGKPIRAIVLMHTFGHPANLEELTKIALKYKLEMVEDAAESLGSLYKGKHTGNFGKVSIFSFNGNKIITTGGGGVLVSNDTELADRAKHLTTTAKLPHQWRYCHDQVGYNYRLPNINAALGCAQMEQLESFVEKKRRLAMMYKEKFDKVQGLLFFEEPDFARSNYWFNTIILNHTHADIKEQVLKATNDSGYMTRPLWTLMHKLPMFRNCPKGDLSVSEDLEKRVINIPSSPLESFAQYPRKNSDKRQN